MVPLSYSLPVAVGMLLFNVVVFSPTILLSHRLALHCKDSGFPYSVDSGSLYKAVGHDPYSSPIHRGSGRPAGSSVFPREEFCCRWERDKCLGGGGINSCVKHLCQHLGLERIREKHLPLLLQHKPAEETAILRVGILLQKRRRRRGLEEVAGVEGPQSLMGTESDTFSQSE